ncbi:hypothetical protein [Corynebacterium sp.]|uniref:hypothetical protein n=1 Tax=Corynebacterium sp. TaxID=1720 RepID=UPI0028AE5E41|nr:hypothetical protein [Corynebacterium sp.]
MNNNKFTNSKTVITGFFAAVLGVLVYCFAVAPLSKDPAFREVAIDTFMRSGLGVIIALVVIAAIWLGVIAFRRKQHKPH